MSHYAQIQFCKQVKKLFPGHFREKIVADIGSLDINGSARSMFRKCDYTGVDITPGRNVDVVKPGHEFLAPYPNRFDVIISCEMLEHDQYWEKTLCAMWSALKPGGLLLITCAGDGRAEHGTKDYSPQDSPATPDYYLNISNEMFSSVLPPGAFTEYYLRQINMDLQFYGIKAENCTDPTVVWDGGIKSKW